MKIKTNTNYKEFDRKDTKYVCSPPDRIPEGSRLVTITGTLQIIVEVPADYPYRTKK
jgi:hypothetical protein